MHARVLDGAIGANDVTGRQRQAPMGLVVGLVQVDAQAGVNLYEIGGQVVFEPVTARDL